MIFQAMELIRKNLNAFLAKAGIPPGDTEPVILGNIAFASDNPDTVANEINKVYLSLVNVEEEVTLRNQSGLRQSDIRPMAYTNPPMHVNLFLLFSANLKNYEMALQVLGLILVFFQGNRCFSFSSTPVKMEGPFTTLDENEHKIKIHIDLMSLTFEQINHLWGSLAGKQVPFLLFKGRQVEIDADRMLRGGELITEIKTIYQ